MPKGPLDSPALPDQPGMCRARYVLSPYVLSSFTELPMG